VKLPNYAIKESFFRIVANPTQLNHGVFLLCGKCPICSDWRRRLYLKEYPQKHMVYCHNCAYSKNYLGFLKDNYPYELDNLRMHQLDLLRTGNFFKTPVADPIQVPVYTFDHLDFTLRKYLKFNAFPIIEEQTNEQKEKFRKYCIDYLVNRKIDEKIYLSFYCIFKGPLAKYLGIPFFDESEEKLIHIQGRRMFTPKNEEEESLNPKYKFLKDTQYDIEIDSKPLWGQWLVDKTKDVMVCEGTLDAPAFDNSVALCGATLSLMLIEKIQKDYPKRIWCIDNFWKDKAGKELTTKLLEMGEKCFIIPKNMTSKDANDLLKELNVDKISMEYVNENVYEGKLGLFKLAMLDDFIGYEKKFVNYKKKEE
jgi:hypothetical protein